MANSLRERVKRAWYRPLFWNIVPCAAGFLAPQHSFHHRVVSSMGDPQSVQKERWLRQNQDLPKKVQNETTATAFEHNHSKLYYITQRQENNRILFRWVKRAGEQPIAMKQRTWELNIDMSSSRPLEKLHAYSGNDLLVLPNQKSAIPLITRHLKKQNQKQSKAKQNKIKRTT